jgi:hypothetical protein
VLTLSWTTLSWTDRPYAIRRATLKVEAGQKDNPAPCCAAPHLPSSVPMTSIRLGFRVCLAALFACLPASVAAAQPAAAANQGAFRFETPARLTVKSSCAIGLKNGDVLVVMTDAPIDCAAAAKSNDPQDAVLNSGGVAARVHFTIKAGGKLGPVFLANVAGASTYTDDANGTLKAGAKAPGRIAGTVTSGGVKKVLLYQGERAMEYDLTFDTPIVKAAK